MNIHKEQTCKPIHIKIHKKSVKKKLSMIRKQKPTRKLEGKGSKQMVKTTAYIYSHKHYLDFRGTQNTRKKEK